MPLDPDQPPQDFRSVLASVDQQGRRRFVFADIAGGAWRRRRAALAVVLIGFYLALPFVEIGGVPLLLIDIPDRSFAVLGQLFHPQDLKYLVFFVLIGLIGTLFLVSLFGRVFCGWLCPHNVFLEMVFRPIEQWLEGRGHRRERQQGRDLSGAQVGRKGLKWALFVLVSGALANTATAIFVGREAFLGGVLIDPVAHPSAAVFFAVAFGAILFNFAWFREQSCLVVCPYGKIQAAMLDPHTLNVAYDEGRGEPRGKPGQVAGDCVDCRRCVQVCPTGIDIRNGLQFECIHCTACIDACDAVMTRLERPPGLIRYASERELSGQGRGRLLRPRSVLYGGLLLLLLILTVASLSTRSDVQVIRLRDTTAAVYDTDQAGGRVVRKVVNLQLVNQSREAQTVVFSLPERPEAVIRGRDVSFELPVEGERKVVLHLEIPCEVAPPAVDLLVRSGDEETLMSVEIRR